MTVSNSDCTNKGDLKDQEGLENNNNSGSIDLRAKNASPRPTHGWTWAIAYASMISATFLFALDNTIVADIQLAILDQFNQTSLLLWIGVGFALGTMCVLPWGKVYGVFNAKYMFLVSGIVLAMAYYVPLFFQFLRGDGPLDAGVRLLPFIISMVVFALFSGALMPKLPYIMPWHLVGSALVVIGTALMYTINLDTSNAKIYGYTILVGAGSGCYVVAGFPIVQSLVSSKDIPNAVGAMAISQDLGMVTFLSVASSIYQNISLKKVGRALSGLRAEEITDLVAGTSSRSYKALTEANKELVIPQIMDAMRNVWLFFLVAAALSFMLSPLLWKTKLNGVAALLQVKLCEPQALGVD